MPSFAKWGNDLYTGRRSYDIVGRRNTWYAIAAVVVLGSVLLLVFKGLNPGIEFRGGSEFRVTGVSDTSEQTAVDAVDSVMGQSFVPRVSVIGDSSVRVQTERLSDAQTEDVSGALAQAYRVGAGSVTSSFVGPSWGADVTGKALRALVIFLVLVAAVIAIYFRNWKMSVAALVALLHDVIATAGIYALVGFEVTPATVIGFLTILGYSLYDTVVVFDKVRENTTHTMTGNRRTLAEAANLGVNQTLVRSINTSVVASLPVASILLIGAFVLGAGTLKDISLALLIGIIAGTYSSVFLATPMWVHLRGREPEVREQAARVAARRSAEARKAGAAGEAATVAAGGGTTTAVLERTEASTEDGQADATGTPGEPRSPGAGAPPARQTSRGPRNQPRKRGKKGRR